MLTREGSLRIEWVEIDELIPYVNNPKQHPPEQINLIASSIKEFGFINPIIVDKQNEIIAGHGRLLAAKKLGLKKVPILRAEHLTPAQVKAYRIADNKLTELGEWDSELLRIELEELREEEFDLELTGFDLGEIDELLEGLNFLEEQEEKQDDVPEATDIPPFSRYGDLWILGEHRLLCGDATRKEDLERLMNGEKADMVFTDPPYGVSYADKNEFLNEADKGNRVQRAIKGDDLPVDEFKAFLFQVFSNLRDFLAEYSAYYVMAPQGGNQLYVMMMMEKAGLPPRHELIWNKNNHVLGRVDYLYKHEPILYGWINKHKFYGKGKYTKSVWDIPKPQKSDLHPTMKPVELIENAILNSTLKGQIVLDVFGGSGSTLIACEKTKRKARILEIEEHYCDVIVKRYLDFTGREDVTLVREGEEIPFSEIKGEFLKRFVDEA